MQNPGILVVGGARSGKSQFAERLAIKSGLPRVYVATCEAYDDEMRARIDRHQRDRDHYWDTIEEQIDLVGVLAREAAADRVLLVDCLTLWLSNLMMQERDLELESERLCAAVADLKGPCVFVSNEVGMGIVPDNRLSRSFRDAQGRLNQDIGHICGKVVFVASGQPILLKPRQGPEIIL
ncbi:bifunctional adenosylcobinamide kinase/adenosylcobinamide-phosphate guanylyltransferase [Roseibium sp. RKSG952]|nr:bifunctional adenosylcobinamide kinase/adenosylcobinamide-phosphate guanylyltransferase [Roseibium sp. RKSG952]